ncbi:MAG TPA: Tol-Pal system beta propeller repeat protein TolB [Rhizomicrobium sp.]|nr:Tol-Pal system beta propeller repeat protein TolB [Rhizomicrobium sp.]
MRKLFLSLALVLAAAVMPRPAFAALSVDITQGNFQPLPIAIPDFASTGTAGADIAGVVRADLERSGLFRPIDPKAFVDHSNDINAVPNFANWRTINALGLAVGSVVAQSDGQLRVEFRLWDVSAGAQIWGQKFTTIPANWRRIAHMISDAIYEHVTGEKGYFDTRIVFISETGTAQKRVKRLAIMDQDGANPIFLTPGSYIVLTPRFNPTAQMIAFMSYIGGKPRVYLFDIESGRSEVLGNFPNMTFSPRFSPDGNRVVLTLETAGNSDIYMMDLRNRAISRLTTDLAIDTAPSFSPDGRQIVFESDRGGSQQIYVMNVDGSNQHRISFTPGANGTPVWSPRGDLIAFTKRVGAVFNIGVMRPDGSGERLISAGPRDEGPTWAPNGRVLMFSRSLSGGQGSQIWSIDVTGRNERRVLTPGSASDPAWSPLIQ